MARAYVRRKPSVKLGNTRVWEGYHGKVLAMCCACVRVCVGGCIWEGRGTREGAAVSGSPHEASSDVRPSFFQVVRWEMHAAQLALNRPEFL